MRISLRLVVLLASLSWACGVPAAEEPVIGGPCEGCDVVFENMPLEMGSRGRIAPGDEEGEPMVIEGTVRAGDGTPAAGIIVYAYHTNDAGIYPAGSTRHGRLRGWVRTDEAGRYRFDTIRPGAYPSRNAPQHIHMHVIEPECCTYYVDDILFDDDPLLTEEHRRTMLRGRGGSGLTHPEKDGRGAWHVRRDITLGKRIPGHE